MVRTAINELPQEITDCIIDCLADDRAALKTCALVQRSWLARARDHLHHTLTIDCSQKKALPAHYYTTGAAAHVRTLKLIAPPPPPAQGARDARARALWRVLPRFSGLRALTVVFADWGAPGAAPHEWLRPALGRVEALTLVFAAFGAAPDLFALAAACPALRALALTNLSFRTGALTALPARPPPGLRELVVTGHIVPPEVTRAFALWLCLLPRPPIPRFRVKWEVGQSECLVPIVDGLGPRLAHLELPVWSARYLPTETIKSALQSISFITLAPEVTKDDVAEILAFLGRIPTHELRSIALDVRAAPPAHAIDEHALHALDDALFGAPHAPCASLSAVRFRVPRATAVASFSSGMPRAQKRGALLVEVAPGDA